MALEVRLLHLLRLCAKGAAENSGWAPVSATVFPLLSKLPRELIEINALPDGRGLARPTEAGLTVLRYS